MAQSKATKRFEKNHLKDVLKKRREFAKVKQRIQVREKKRARRAEDAPDADAIDPSTKALGQMSVDEFFQEGVEVPQRHKINGTSSRKSKRKLADLNDEHAQGEHPASDVDAARDDEDSAGDDDFADSSGGFKKQLDSLAENDPEFYEYLKANDAELLDFDDDENLPNLDELSEEESQDAERAKKQKKKKKLTKQEDEGLEAIVAASAPHVEPEATAGQVVTKTLVEKWKDAMIEQHSLRATREIVLAFRAAVHANDEKVKEYKYSVTNPDVYHELLIVALTHVREVLEHHLPVKENAAGKIRIANETKKYSTLSPLIKSHASAILHLLGNLSDTATLQLTLNSLLSFLPYVLSYKKLVRELAKDVVEIWSDWANTESTRITAFLVLRRLMVIGDPGIRESVLRSTYQGLIKGSRNTTSHTLPGINLMKNSAAELWGIDCNVGYATGFTFVRQLAIHLRASIKNNSNDSYKTVYNWQYVHSLDFWSRTLSVHCNSLKEAEASKISSLRPLIYPVVQVTLGAMRLIPTPQYFPLRFQLVRSLLRLSLATSTYIPLAPPLYEVLTSAEMRKQPKASTLKALDFRVSIRALKSYLKTRVYQDGIGEEVSELFSEFFVLWSKSIAFPELVLPVIFMLKRWLKGVSHPRTGNHNGKVNGAIALLVQKLEANARWVEERRAAVEFAPTDRAGVEGFLKGYEWEKTPLGAFVAGQRKGREERARLVEAGRREAQKRETQQNGTHMREAGRARSAGSDAGDISEGEEDAGAGSESS